MQKKERKKETGEETLGLSTAKCLSVRCTFQRVAQIEMVQFDICYPFRKHGALFLAQSSDFQLAN